jgi:hypothetical protein
LNQAVIWFSVVAKKYPLLRCSYLYGELDNYFRRSATAVASKVVNHEEEKPEDFFLKDIFC